MKRIWRKLKPIIRVTFLWTLIMLLVVDSALACRLFRRRANCRPAASYCQPVYQSACATSVSTSSNCGTNSYSTSTGACGTGSCGTGTSGDSGAMYGSGLGAMPGSQGLAPAPSKVPNGGSIDTNIAPPPPVQPQASQPTTPRTVEPATGDRTTIEPRATEPRVTEPRTTVPRAIEPRTTEPRAAEPVPLNPFDSGRRSSPAGERVPMPRPSLDDPFGPTTTTPTSPLPTPATRTPSEPSSTVPAPTLPAPTTPNTTTPATPLDDPFGVPASPLPRSSEIRSPGQPSLTTTGRPMLPPADAALPGETTLSPVNNPVLADPFAPAAAKSIEKPSDAINPTSTDKIDTPSLEPPARKPATASDDPFAEPAPSTTQLEPMDAMRTWVDVTGKHRIRGQLKEILADQGKVRILKETGRFTTVPMERLGDADRQFVATHSNSRDEASNKLAASSSR